MSTGNIDVNTLADALTIALKPIRQAQEKILRMQMLSTIVGAEQINQLHQDHTALTNEEMNAENSARQGKLIAERFRPEVTSPERDQKEEKEEARRQQRLEKAKANVLKFEEKNSLYIQALRDFQEYK